MSQRIVLSKRVIVSCLAVFAAILVLTGCGQQQQPYGSWNQQVLAQNPGMNTMMNFGNTDVPFFQNPSYMNPSIQYPNLNVPNLNMPMSPEPNSGYRYTARDQEAYRETMNYYGYYAAGESRRVVVEDREEQNQDQKTNTDSTTSDRVTDVDASRSGSCATGSCKVSPAEVKVESSTQTKSIESENGMTAEKEKLEPQEKLEIQPPFDLSSEHYLPYFKKMLPNYASEDLTGIKIETMTYRHFLEAGKVFEQFKKEQQGMANCEQMKSNEAMIQLETHYAILHQKELEHEQTLSAQVEKIEKKLMKIKNVQKREQQRSVEMKKLWKSFDQQKVVKYFDEQGVSSSDILMMATPHLNSFLDSVDACIADAQKLNGSAS
jgi:hypothetical protein